jgi:hypothetical protein
VGGVLPGGAVLDEPIVEGNAGVQLSNAGEELHSFMESKSRERVSDMSLYAPRGQVLAICGIARLMIRRIQSRRTMT